MDGSMLFLSLARGGGSVQFLSYMRVLFRMILVFSCHGDFVVKLHIRFFVPFFCSFLGTFWPFFSAPRVFFCFMCSALFFELRG